MTLPAVIFSLFLLAPTSAEVSVVQFPPKTRITLSLGGKNKADVERAGTVAKVFIQAEGLQPPQSVQSRMNSYVVWAVSPEGSFDNLGELEITKEKGNLTATTRFDRFAIIITAEPHYMVDRPNSRIIYKNELPKAVPAVPLMIEIGSYEYTNLPENTGGAPALVMEARAALAVASSVSADRRADSEFRQAKAALDTLEELYTRGSTPDVIAAAANVAIRRAHRAETLARQSFR
jgi:hypothetical protein